MSVSSSHLRGILSSQRPLSHARVNELRTSWQRTHGGPKNSLRYTVLGPGEKFDLADLIRDCQERLKDRPTIQFRPALRVPFPFSLGPNGPFLLLVGLLFGLAAIVGVLVACGAA